MHLASSLFASLSGGRRSDHPPSSTHNSRGLRKSVGGRRRQGASSHGLSFSKNHRPPLPPRPPQPGYDPPKRPSTPAKILSKLSRNSDDDVVGLQNAAREAGIIAFYRKQLLRAHAELSDAWALFEATPDAGYNTRQVRLARQALSNALNDYYAATGVRATPSISHILRAAEESDVRIAALNHEIIAEVARFEALARDAAADASAADADDALLELEAYRRSIADSLEEETLARLDTAHATLASIVETSGSMSIARPPSPPPDEFAFVPSAPEPREFPPLPPPSQQNLTTLVEAAKLYKNEMERNRMSSIITTVSVGASSEDSKQTIMTAAEAAEAEMIEAELELKTHSLTVMKEERPDETGSHSRRSSAAISLRSKRPQSPMEIEMETRSLAILREHSEDILTKGSQTSTGLNVRSSGVGVRSSTSSAIDGLPSHSFGIPSRKNSPPLRAGSVKSHSLRVPTIRTTSLNLRKRLLSHPMPPPPIPPNRDSTIAQEAKQPTGGGNGPRRSRSVMKMRSRNTAKKEEVPKRRRRSSIFNFTKSTSQHREPSIIAQKIAPQPPFTDDLLTRRISSVIEEEMKASSMGRTEIISNTHQHHHHHHRATSASSPHLGRKHVGSSMRSFWGLMRNQPTPTKNERPVNRQRRDVTGHQPPLPPPPPPQQQLEENGGVTMGFHHSNFSSKERQLPSPPSSPSPPPSTTQFQDNDVVMKDKSSDDTNGTSADGSVSNSTESGEELPKDLVMPRAPTLRDAAEFARQQEEEEVATSFARRSTPRRTSAASFSTALYSTPTRRAEAVSDVGVLLTCSKVMGDGRCLFRSVARGRAVAKSEAIPKPHQEKKAADKLRARAVAELRRNRGLLLKFYVIEEEENFDRYIERMSQPRTYAGEPELLMLAKVLRMPIAVYLLMHNGMYRRIQLYGKHYHGEPIRIRYVNDTHYDTLMPSTYPYRGK